MWLTRVLNVWAPENPVQKDNPMATQSTVQPGDVTQRVGVLSVPFKRFVTDRLLFAIKHASN